MRRVLSAHSTATFPARYNDQNRWPAAIAWPSNRCRCPRSWRLSDAVGTQPGGGGRRQVQPPPDRVQEKVPLPARWRAPVFCTRCYESTVWGTGKGLTSGIRRCGCRGGVAGATAGQNSLTIAPSRSQDGTTPLPLHIGPVGRHGLSTPDYGPLSPTTPYSILLPVQRMGSTSGDDS